MIITYHAKFNQPGISTINFARFFASGASALSKAFSIIWAD